MYRGKLIDAYRFLHKEKDMDRGFSWSGHPIGKYEASFCLSFFTQLIAGSLGFFARNCTC